MKVLVDVDDVLFPFTDLAHAACERAGITNGHGLPATWQPWDEYGCTVKAWAKALRIATKDGLLYSSEPMPGSMRALEQLHELGHTIHIVTARGFFPGGNIVKGHTIRWLDEWSVPHDTLTFAKDKTLVKVDVAVDDSPKNIAAIETTGATAWLVEAPHNTGVEHPRRVPTIGVFVEQFLAGAWA